MAATLWFLVCAAVVWAVIRFGRPIRDYRRESYVSEQTRVFYETGIDRRS